MMAADEGLSTQSENLKAFWQFLARYGVGSLIAIYLVYQLVDSSKAQAAQQQIQAEQLKNLNGQLDHAAQTLLIHQAEARLAAEKQTRVLQVICVQGAKNSYERRDCLQ